MNPVILVDINKDGGVDIVTAGFSDHVMAFDGETLIRLWIYTLAGTQTYS